MVNQTVTDELDDESDKPTDESDQAELAAQLLPPMDAVASCCGRCCCHQEIAMVILEIERQGSLVCRILREFALGRSKPTVFLV